MTPVPIDRRQLLAGAAMAAGGVLLAGGGLGRAEAQGYADETAMAAAVELQQALAVVYAGLARRPGIARDVAALLAHLADHERRHAAALLKLAEYIGVLPPPIPSFSDVEAALPHVRSAVDRASALAVIEELERAEVLGFISDLQVLTDTKLIQIVGAVMCSDAQHLALTRQAAGRDPIPSAFETGVAR
jgi:hypothetical protein